MTTVDGTAPVTGADSGLMQALRQPGDAIGVAVPGTVLGSGCSQANLRLPDSL